MCPSSGVACLARDTESSKQVWSAVEGYPGDYHYREFYRDIGFDLDYEYLKPHLHQNGIRSNLGIKYYKITGRSQHKEVYKPQAALEKAAEHAGNFMFNREKQVEWLRGAMDRPPLIVAPYDAELFGHWWFEGPDWINFLLRKIHWDQQTIKTITVPEYLDRHRRIQVAAAVVFELGLQGLLRSLAGRLQRLDLPPSARGRRPHGGTGPAHAEPATALRRRALNQAARELLLAQSSDWAFIMKTGTMVEYAHAADARPCAEFQSSVRADQGQRDRRAVAQSKSNARHNLFPNMDYRVYA